MKEEELKEIADKKKVLDPKQIAFLTNYLNINSDTFGNAKRSAIKSGYSEEYADNITSLMPNWLSENIGDEKMLLKAEKNLNKLLDEEKDLKVKADITKFVAERLGKAKYSQKSEVNLKGELSWGQIIKESNENNK